MSTYEATPYDSAAVETVADAVEAFRRDLGIRRSPHTVEAYTTALRHFEVFCAEAIGAPGEVPAAEITPDVAMSFVRWLQASNPVSHTTLDNYLTAVSRFYRWLMLEGRASFAAADYARLQERLTDVRGRRPPRPLPHVPAEDAVQALLQAAYAVPLPDEPNTDKGRRATLRRLRDIALLEALRSSGARVGEIVALRRGDLDYERRGAVVPARGASSGSFISDDSMPGGPHPLCEVEGRRRRRPVAVVAAPVRPPRPGGRRRGAADHHQHGADGD